MTSIGIHWIYHINGRRYQIVLFDDEIVPPSRQYAMDAGDAFDWHPREGVIRLVNMDDRLDDKLITMTVSLMLAQMQSGAIQVDT